MYEQHRDNCSEGHVRLRRTREAENVLHGVFELLLPVSQHNFL